MKIDPEAVVLLLGMLIIFGGTLAVNFFINLLIPGLGN
jgi:hypothetical protein|tara:strand:+ start:420 stop:533 length:114 start_codon:yes stop_codon:yes gene_type:complete